MCVGLCAHFGVGACEGHSAAACLALGECVPGLVVLFWSICECVFACGPSRTGEICRGGDPSSESKVAEIYNSVCVCVCVCLYVNWCICLCFLRPVNQCAPLKCNSGLFSQVWIHDSRIKLCCRLLPGVSIRSAFTAAAFLTVRVHKRPDETSTKSSGFIFAYPSGTEPLKSVLKRGGGKRWKVIGGTFCLSPSNKPISFVFPAS